MKKSLVFTVMLLSVFALCYAQSALSGMYRFSENAHITFTGNAFTGAWNRTTPISGTYSVSGSRLTLNIIGGPRAGNIWTWTVVDANTIRDQDGDTWRRVVTGSAGTTTQASNISGRQTLADFLSTFRTNLENYNGLGDPGRVFAASPDLNVSWAVNNTSSWAEAVNGIINGGNNKIHTITVSENITVSASETNTFGSITNTLVILQGSGTISSSGNGALLRVGNGQAVIAKDLTLQGRNSNNDPVVVIEDGGIFCMEGSASLTGNTFNGRGGGVHVGGIFVMRDNASVSENKASNGGAVYVNGTFLMQGGTVSDNSASSISGGVYVDGDFIMKGGIISDNTANSGGGVYVDGNFTMQGGAVSGNKANMGGGGGVHIRNGNFTMQDDALISGNSARIGGGVYAGSGIFTMQDGEISGNSAREDGGGIYATEFTINNGTISGNSAGNRGGGVFLSRTFTKTGGIIYGRDETDIRFRNTASRGHALYDGRINRWRGATAGPSMNHDTFGFWQND